MLLFSKKKNGQSVDRWHFSYICIMKRGFLFVCLWLYSFNFWGREVIGTYWKPIDEIHSIRLQMCLNWNLYLPIVFIIGIR